MSSKSPAVSVVMSVYNGEQYLAEAVESILGQTYKDFEFIIIDDGSTDKSPEIIKKYAKTDKRIKIISQANQGLVASLNRGIREAKGEYIARMDADDISLPSRLEEELGVFQSNPRVTLVGTSFIFIDEGGQIIGRQGVLLNDRDLKRELCLRNPFGHGSVMLLRTAVQTAGGYSAAVGPVEDYELWLRLAKNNGVFFGIPKFLYKWRINPSGISQANNLYQNAKTAELAAGFRSTHHPPVNLLYLRGRKKVYRRLGEEAYLRYMEDQWLFFRMYLRERQLANAFKTAVLVSSAPKFLTPIFIRDVKSIPDRLKRLAFKIKKKL